MVIVHYLYLVLTHHPLYIAVFSIEQSCLLELLSTFLFFCSKIKFKLSPRIVSIHWVTDNEYPLTVTSFNSFLSNPDTYIHLLFSHQVARSGQRRMAWFFLDTQGCEKRLYYWSAIKTDDILYCENLYIWIDVSLLRILHGKAISKYRNLWERTHIYSK